MSAAGIVIISPDALMLRLVERAGTWDVVFWRLLFVGLSLFVYLAAAERRMPWERFRRLGRLGWLSTLVLAAAQVGFVAAISRTSAANTLVLLATMPLFGALLGWFLLREAVAPRTQLAIGVAFLGIVVIFADSLGRGDWTGDALALLTALLYASNLVILRRAGDAIMVPALCLSGFLAALAALPFADPLAVGGRDLAILGWLGLVQLPLALVLFFGGTRHVPAAEVALMSLIETVLGPFLAWLGVGEEPPAAAFAGGGLVILAIVANSLLALRRRPGARRTAASR